MLIWADFPSGQRGLYGTTTSYMLNGIWAEVQAGSSGGAVAIVDDPDSNIGSLGKVLRFSGGATGGGAGFSFSRFVNPSGAQATTGMGFRLWANALPQTVASSGNAAWWFRTSSNTNIIYFRLLPDGSIGCYNSSDTLLGQSGPVITPNAYHHIETRVLRHASAGEAEVRVNGNPVLDLDTLALGSSDIGMTLTGSWTRGSSEVQLYNHYKDWTYWDGSGSEVNDFQGSVAVHDLLPDSDNSLGWTPSTGSTGWDLVDEGNTGPDDADYISADDTPPSPTIFTMTDLPADVTTVRGLIAIGRLVKTDGGDCDVQMSLSPNGTDWDDGADRPITVAETYWWDVSTVSPDTAAAWTPAEVNDLLFRIDRTL